MRPRLRASTFATYSTFATKYVQPRIGAIPIAALSAASLNGFYADLLDHGGRDGRPLAAKTVRHVHQLIRTALGDAFRWGMVPRNVAEAADPPAVRRPEMHVWTADELGAFLDVHGRRPAGRACGYYSPRQAYDARRRSGCHGRPSTSPPGRLAVVQTAVKAGTATVLDRRRSRPGRGERVALDAGHRRGAEGASDASARGADGGRAGVAGDGARVRP